MKEGDSITEVVKEITSEQVLLYAKASGDFNPIHVDAKFAEGSQFGRNIAHGMMVAASISESMSLTFGASWHASGKVKITFRSPAYPGDTVTASGQIQKNSTVKRRNRNKMLCFRNKPSRRSYHIWNFFSDYHRLNSHNQYT